MPAAKTSPFPEKVCRKMHVEADKYNTGALVQKYEAGIKGFFKDEDLVSLPMFLLSVNVVNNQLHCSNN